MSIRRLDQVPFGQMTIEEKSECLYYLCEDYFVEIPSSLSFLESDSTITAKSVDAATGADFDRYRREIRDSQFRTEAIMLSAARVELPRRELLLSLAEFDFMYSPSTWRRA